MREAVFEVLAEVLGPVMYATAAVAVAGKSSLPVRRGRPDPALDAVLQFAKRVGAKAGDYELVDYCVNAEVQLCDVDSLAEAVRQLCIHHFFHQPKFRVDMSRYRALIEGQAAAMDDREEVRKLYAYVDEDRKLNDVYEGVKRRLCVPLLSAPSVAGAIQRPTFEDLRVAVEAEVAEVYRRADKHFAKRLSRADAKGPESGAEA